MIMGNCNCCDKVHKLQNYYSGDIKIEVCSKCLKKIKKREKQRFAELERKLKEIAKEIKELGDCVL